MNLLYMPVQTILLHEKKSIQPTSKQDVSIFKVKLKYHFSMRASPFMDYGPLSSILKRANYVYGLTDLENHVLIPVRYKNIYPLGTLRYAVENETGKIALHGEDGKPITDFQIDSISPFRNSKAIIYENLNQGLIDRDGIIKLKSIYRSIQIIGENKVNVQPHHEWFFITDKNEIVNRFSADELIPVNEKLFIVKTSGKYGLINNDLKRLPCAL